MNTGSWIWITRCALVSAALASLVGVPGNAAAQANDFPIPGHGSLHLTVPGGWQAESRSLGKPPSATIHLTPRIGGAFDVQITAMWVDAKAAAKTTASMKKNMQKAARNLLGSAEEKSETLVELKGTECVGWYYSLTDKNPAPGEFKYLTQGSFAVREVIVAFTILTRSPAGGEVQDALRMFADSTYTVPGADNPSVRTR